jgi:hypothetical protein
VREAEETLVAAGAGGGGGNDSLLQALQQSHSRAREAEEKLVTAGASNGGLWAHSLSLLKSLRSRSLKSCPTAVFSLSLRVRRSGLAPAPGCSQPVRVASRIQMAGSAAEAREQGSAAWSTVEHKAVLRP